MKSEGQAVRPALFCYYYFNTLYFIRQDKIHILEYWHVEFVAFQATKTFLDSVMLITDWERFFVCG